MFSAHKKIYLEWSVHVLLILGVKSNTIKTWLFSKDIIKLFIYLFSFYRY